MNSCGNCIGPRKLAKISPGLVRKTKTKVVLKF